jgi:hypothetical protein
MVYKLDYKTDSEFLGKNYFKSVSYSYNRTNENGISSMYSSVVYVLASEGTERRADFVGKTSSSDKLYSVYKLLYSTDSEYFGKYIKYMDIYYDSRLENKQNAFTLIVDYKRGHEMHIRRANLTVSTDCINGDCKNYHIYGRNDNDLWGRYVRSFNMDYVHSFQNDENDMSLDMDFYFRQQPERQARGQF